MVWRNVIATQELPRLGVSSPALDVTTLTDCPYHPWRLYSNLMSQTVSHQLCLNNMCLVFFCSVTPQRYLRLVTRVYIPNAFPYMCSMRRVFCVFLTTISHYLEFSAFSYPNTSPTQTEFLASRLCLAGVFWLFFTV